MNTLKVTIVDMYDFRREVTLEEAVIMNQVEERMKEQARVWWAYEANRGAGWYLQPEVANPPSSPQSTSSSSLSHVVTSVGTKWARSLSYHVASHSQPTSPSPLVPGEASDQSFSTSLSNAVSTAGNSILLKRLIRKGIPLQLRPKVWNAISGASRKKEQAPEGYYRDLLRAVQGKESISTKQIEADLHRTFPCHPKIDTEDGRAALRRVLVAYSWRDSRVGYCQGMNFVAAYLLLVMRTEEEAFWLLAVLLEDVLLTDSYSEDLLGCHVEQRVLKDLLIKKLPKLSAHLDAISFELSLVCTEWFLCIFAKSFPAETTLRVWDVLFNEGAKVLFRLGLAIFKMKEAELLVAQNLGDAIKILQSFTHHTFDPDVLLKVAFDKLGSMSMTTISRQRKKQQPAVIAELEGRLRKLSPARRGPQDSAATI
eukprot:SM000101S09271  [mRNA]  locus=s101:373940:377059:+ [translate_table: standard]